MAAESNGHSDMQAHLKSYSLFAALMKWGGIACAAAALIVVVYLAGRY